MDATECLLTARIRVSAPHRFFSSPREVVATAAELRSLAKMDQGSAFAMDRRCI